MLPDATVRAIDASRRMRRSGGRGGDHGGARARDLRARRQQSPRAGAGSTSLFIHARAIAFAPSTGCSPTSISRARRCSCCSPPSSATERWRRAYAHALHAGYRFLSLGDCMLCWRACVTTAFDVDAADGTHGAGTLTTAHGTVRTPAFMPVGTHATVKALHPDEVRDAGVDILLCNAYHLALRPGIDLIERAGGLHAFMGWDHPILTDSGGYQLVSLVEVAAVDDDGATFVSPYDGSRLRVTPEDAVQQPGAARRRRAHVPRPPGRARHDATASRGEATERTHRWAERCRAAHPGDGRLLFGIAQGEFDAAARAESAPVHAGLDFDGVAIGRPLGGGARRHDAGHDRRQRRRAGAPTGARYFMGLGHRRGAARRIALGVDMFDCVVPTRLARNGSALTPDGGSRCAMRRRRTTSARSIRSARAPHARGSPALVPPPPLPVRRDPRPPPGQPPQHHPPRPADGGRPRRRSASHAFRRVPRGARWPAQPRRPGRLDAQVVQDHALPPGGRPPRGGGRRSSSTATASSTAIFVVHQPLGQTLTSAPVVPGPAAVHPQGSRPAGWHRADH